MAKTNYILALQDENAEMKKIIAKQEKMIAEFRAHLASAKFHKDTTIQTRDVDARLVQMYHGLSEVDE